MGDPWLPLFVRVEGLRVAVLGCGTVGSRRARLFACKGAEVRVYAREFAQSIRGGCGERIELVEADLMDAEKLREAVDWGDIIVVATGDPRLNEMASRIALEKGKLVNGAADYRLGNVIVPFQAETSYGLKIAVTSLGRTGIASRKILEDILKMVESEYYIALFNVMARVKEWLKKNIEDYKLRYNLYFAVGDSPRVLSYIRKGDEERAFEEALRVVREYLERNS